LRASLKTRCPSFETLAEFILSPVEGLAPQDERGAMLPSEPLVLRRPGAKRRVVSKHGCLEIIAADQAVDISDVQLLPPSELEVRFIE